MANHSIWNKHEPPATMPGLQASDYETFDMPSVGGVCLSAPHKSLSSFWGDVLEHMIGHITYEQSFQAGLGGGGCSGGDGAALYLPGVLSGRLALHGWL